MGTDPAAAEAARAALLRVRPPGHVPHRRRVPARAGDGDVLEAGADLPVQASAAVGQAGLDAGPGPGVDSWAMGMEVNMTISLRTFVPISNDCAQPPRWLTLPGRFYVVARAHAA